MDATFWQKKWVEHELAFHLPVVHPILERSLPLYGLADHARIFLPLCGKTLDIGYLLARQYQVVGVELSSIAVTELFEALGVAPEITEWAGGKCWRHGGLTVFEGDFFALTPEDLGPVDLVHDRAALVALPDGMRERYVSRLLELTNGAQQLVISFEYDQSQMEGPPFAVPAVSMERLYGGRYRLEELSRKDVINNIPAFQERGLARFEEVAWRLWPR
jgi:thiopurine S-methyltransferase